MTRRRRSAARSSSSPGGRTGSFPRRTRKGWRRVSRGRSSFSSSRTGGTTPTIAPTVTEASRPTGSRGSWDFQRPEFPGAARGGCMAYFGFCRRVVPRTSMAKPKKSAEPSIVKPDDIDPHHNWKRPLHAPGHTQVDFEERVNFRRLHDYRLSRVRAALSGSELGALLSFDQHNIRYTTSTVIGEWARDKLTRYSLLTGNGDPYVWDFGSAAKHHRLYAPWLHQDHCRAGLLGMRGAVGTDLVLFRDAAREIKSILDAEGVGNMPLGVDVVEPPMLFELQKLGIEVRDGQQVMLQAREVKSADELTLLNMAAAMVDGVYQDIAEALKPGVRESQIVALATKRLYEMGSDCVEAINSISGERCSPHPHNFTDRLIRPGDQAFFDVIQSFMGYRTCYYRTFNVGRAT